MKAIEVYAGSDGELTKRYYSELQKRGPVGELAVNLFRAQKCSTRAKAYRGGIRGKGSYKSMAYDRKQWSLDNLCKVLAQPENSLTWGWKEDPGTVFGNEPSWVLYVDLPQGQVSFHSPGRGAGPEYLKNFDGARRSAERIVEFCDEVMAMEGATA